LTQCEHKNRKGEEAVQNFQERQTTDIIDETFQESPKFFQEMPSV